LGPASEFFNSVHVAGLHPGDLRGRSIAVVGVLVVRRMNPAARREKMLG
jgi:hypothetical protein